MSAHSARRHIHLLWSLTSTNVRTAPNLPPCAVLIKTKDKSHFRAPFHAPCLALFLTPFSAPFLPVQGYLASNRHPV